MIKVLAKIVKKGILGFVALLLLYLIFSILLSIIPTSPQKLTCTKNNSIYIATNGVHLDIIIPKEHLTNHYIQALELGNKTRYIAFGWGDKGFYLYTPTWKDLEFSTAFKALFLPSETAMHVTRYSARYAHWHQIQLCETQLKDLLNYIDHSFKKTDSGQWLLIPNTGYSQNDSFYEANGHYSCINTCNNWANKGLKIAGIKTALWSPFDKGILFHVH